MGMEKLSADENAELERLAAKAGLYDEPATPERTVRCGHGMGYDDPERQFGEFPAPNPGTVTDIISPEEWVAKQISGLEAKGAENWENGIRRPKADPIKAGIAAQGRYEKQMKRDEVLERRKKGLEATNMDEWVSVCEQVGGQKLVDGVVNRKAKVEKAVSKLQPALAAHTKTVRSMPVETDEQREKKMLANLRGMRKLKGVTKS